MAERRSLSGLRRTKSSYQPSMSLTKQDIQDLFPPTEAMEPLSTPKRTSEQRRQLVFDREMEKQLREKELVRRKSAPCMRHRRSTSEQLPGNFSQSLTDAFETTDAKAATVDMKKERWGKAFHFHDGKLIDVKTTPSRQNALIPLEWTDEIITLVPPRSASDRNSFNGADSAIWEDILERHSLPSHVRL